MRVAFYAPLKPPTHPVASGDRRMARLLMEALTLTGHEVELASRLRSFDGAGDVRRQERIAAIGGRIAARLIARLLARPPSQRPRLWLTYHPFHKSPDWLGPRIAAALAIPYVVAEASVAMKRAGGPWTLGHEATIAALHRAAAVINLNPADAEGVAPHVSHAGVLAPVKPFIETGPYQRAARERAAARRELGRRLSLPEDEPWLLAVGMMRRGDKLASYRVLGEALQLLPARPWRLIVGGDGAARAEVEAALRPIDGDLLRLAGFVAEAELPRFYAAADLFVWPAINEAYCMASLEAQATGLPVVSGYSAGIATIVAQGATGRLLPQGDARAFAAAVAELLDDGAGRAAMAAAARAKIAAEHDLAAAARRLDRILLQACGAAAGAR